MHRRLIKLLGISLSALCIASPVQAQEPYPTKSVRVIVPFPTGNAVDMVARLSADILQAKYGQSFVVENRPGAKGIIGIRMAAEQPRDGYTLVGGGLGNVLPIATLRNLPIDIAKTLVPVGQVAEFANVFIVRANSPLNTIDDLIKYIKSKPAGHVTMGAGDIGSSAHMAMALFEDRTGLDVTHVPYRSQGEIVVNLVGETLDVGISSVPAALSMLRGGRVKALAITSTKRSKHIPEVPTMQESGVKDYNVSSWLGLYATSGTPQNIVDQLGRDLFDGLKNPSYAEKVEAAGMELSPLGPKEFAELNQAEIERWSKFAEQIGAVSTFAE